MYRMKRIAMLFAEAKSHHTHTCTNVVPMFDIRYGLSVANVDQHSSQLT